MEEPATGAHLQACGSSQGGLRQYNERVVLQAVRLHGALPSAAIARQTGLTAQAISLISKRLLDDQLLLRGAPQRGKVGQPSVPLRLNPDGAFAVGIKVGRRSMDVLLVDFTGTVRKRWSLSYRQLEPQGVLDEIAQRLKDVRRTLGLRHRDRLQGVGIAAPLGLGGWQALLGMASEVADAWQHTDLRVEVARRSPWPVQLLKDTAAACVAELVAGRGRQLSSFLYVFVDTLVGGALVLDSQLRAGPHGNAGALGSMPLGLVGPQPADAPAQLLSVASLIKLEERYAQAGLDLAAATDERALHLPWATHTQAWLQEAAPALALAVHNAVCLLELSDVIVNGSFSRPLLRALLDAVDAALDRYNWEGVQRPQLLPGAIGPDARALGGAWMPLYANFAPDRALLMKTAAP